MMTRRQANAGLVSAAIVARASGAGAEGARSKELPPPRATGGKPLIDALKLRRSIREYADRPLPPQVLSDLLWAGFGVNRPSGDRTAPYWRHVMVIDVYNMRRSLMAYGFTIRSSTGWNSALLPTSAARPAPKISSARRRLILSTWLMASACRIYRTKNAACMPPSIPVSSARTSTFSARPKGSPRCSAARSTPRRLGRRCSSAKGSSSHSRSPWATPAPELVRPR
jgi:hypothetical protein